MRWTEGGLVMDAPYSPLDLNSTVTRVVIYLAYVFRPKSVVLGTSSVATVCSITCRGWRGLGSIIKIR
jgi:hypothetical protein